MVGLCLELTAVTVSSQFFARIATESPQPTAKPDLAYKTPKQN
jgi:hypothetical protein